MLARSRDRTRGAGVRASDAHAAMSDPTAAALNLPYAAKLQGYVDGLDYMLTARAQMLVFGVRWWWGERLIDHWHGALCYVCRAQIVTWDTRWPMTDAARAAIIGHGSAHGRDLYGYPDDPARDGAAGVDSVSGGEHR
jgi:hypothetical protein